MSISLAGRDLIIYRSETREKEYAKNNRGMVSFTGLYYYRYSYSSYVCARKEESKGSIAYVCHLGFHYMWQF